jgi:CheY-like chemotaxis protein
LEDLNEGLLRDITSQFSLREKINDLKLFQYAPRLLTRLKEGFSPYVTSSSNAIKTIEFNLQMNSPEEDLFKTKDYVSDHKMKKAKFSENLLSIVSNSKDEAKNREEYLTLRKEEQDWFQLKSSRMMGTTFYEQISMTRFKEEVPKSINGCANGCPAFLICDDDPFNILVLQNFLRVHELPIETAYHGDNAIEKVKTRWEIENCCKSFKLIFMDIEMPQKNGLEAAQEIILFWKEKGEVGCPIIATTGHVEEEENERILKSGMREIISKPINHRDLRELVERLLVK